MFNGTNLALSAEVEQDTYEKSDKNTRKQHARGQTKLQKCKSRYNSLQRCMGESFQDFS